MRRCSNQYARPLHAFTFKTQNLLHYQIGINNYCIVYNEQYEYNLEHWINVRIYAIRQYYMSYNITVVLSI